MNLIKHNLTTHKKLSYLTMLGLRKGENEYTYAACTKQQAEELIRGLREIAPYVVIDCSSYIANDILSAVALMEGRQRPPAGQLRPEIHWLPVQPAPAPSGTALG